MAAGSAPGWALGVLGVVYLFLKLDFISCSQEIYGAMNGNVTFYVSKFHPSTEIIWKKEKNKVVEWDIQSGLEAFQSFKDRVYLDIGSGNLTITRLTKSDEGLYELESPGVRNKSEFHLKVIAPPPSPSTFCSLSDDGNITLTCEIMEAGYDIDGNLLQYSWECPPTVQCHRGLSPSEAYVLKKSDLSQNVQCIVSNPLFRTSASISLSTCVPEDNTRHSETTKNSLEHSLQQLKSHFTWNLVEGEHSLDDFEDRVCHQTEFQNSEFKATMCNIQAFIKHRRGQHQAALECLRQAEEWIQREHADQAEVRSLVTWGNHAWVYYHLGRFADAQLYVDKVKRVCQKFSSPYRIESPELDCEEGWTRLKCGRNQNERAKVCFEKALEKNPKNPEFASGLAIASYRLDNQPPSQNPINPLRQAIQLNPDNQYVKVLLALKLQKMNKKDEGERLVEEALEKAPLATDVIRGAAKLYRRKGDLDLAIELLRKALKCMPNNIYLHCHIGCCYRAKVLEVEKMGGEKEELQKLVRHAIDHLKRADESNGNFFRIGSYLACLHAQVGQYEEAEYYFQKEFSKELPPVAKQVLHLRYGNFQLYQRKCEDKAIHHFIQGVKINQGSKEGEKMKNKLQRFADIKLSKNRADPKALHLLAFLQELNEDMQPAEENSERCLDSGNLIPLASLAEE